MLANPASQTVERSPASMCSRLRLRLLALFATGRDRESARSAATLAAQTASKGSSAKQFFGPDGPAGHRVSPPLTGTAVERASALFRPSTFQSRLKVPRFRLAKCPRIRPMSSSVGRPERRSPERPSDVLSLSFHDYYYVAKSDTNSSCTAFGCPLQHLLKSPLSRYMRGGKGSGRFRGEFCGRNQLVRSLRFSSLAQERHP